jgi:hypothetical protein
MESARRRRPRSALAPVTIRHAAIDGLPWKVPAVTENWTTPRYHGTAGTLAETKRPRFPRPRLRSHGIKGCLTGTPLTHRRLYLAVFSGLPFPFRQRRLVQAHRLPTGRRRL